MKASEIDGVLTLDQLKQVDEQRVLIPETTLYDGGIGTVSVAAKAVIDNIGERWPFHDYGEWIALPDPYGIVEVGGETDV